MKGAKKSNALVFGLLLFFIYCSPSTSPIQDNIWPEASLEDVGFNEAKINKLTQLLLDDTIKNIHSLIIIKNDKIVYEKYFNNFNRDKLHPIYSVTKSVSSALIGIAIDRKFIASVDEKLNSFFPDEKYVDWDNGKEDISLEDILCMTTGLEWNERLPYSDKGNSHNQMCRRSDWIKFVLQRPMAQKPGEKFNYNTGTANLLALMIEQKTGWKIEKFSEEYLFKPLGIQRSRWYKDPKGNPCSGGTNGGLFLKPIDMAKIGYLILNEGKWGKKVIISKEWVQASTEEQKENEKYGYLWWRGYGYINKQKAPFYMGSGYGGQKIYVFPSLDMVIVLTSGNYGRHERRAHFQADVIVRYHILGALGGS
jgi:CubicO group peptidase (beta-lactamase class C family)